MRLIDADALKEEVTKKNVVGRFNTLLLIDNAPTVEPTYISDLPNDKVKDLQELAIDYDEGIAVFERKRPQSEWKNVGFMVCECNNCKEQFHELESNNYCPNCGAKMSNSGWMMEVYT